ncbi:MAG: hypothetical protein ACEQSK_16355 [Sphingomonadaceae bacterium]
MKAMLLLLTVSSAALADDAAILRCRAISDIPARVACYDAMPLTGARAVAPAAVAPTAAIIASPAAAASAPAAPAMTAAADPARDFGLSADKRRPVNEPNEIESTIIGKFDGWGPNTRFRLANGQVWRVADGSDASLWERDNPKVKISRNAIGTMFLEVEGSALAPRVRREQ